MEDGFGRDLRTSKELKIIIDSFDRYVQLTTEENNRLRNLNAAAYTNIKTRSGGRCLEPPQFNMATNRFECLAQTVEKQQSLFGLGPSVEKVVEKLDEVDRSEYDKYEKSKKEYDRRNKFGGLEERTFIAPAKTLDKDKKYILLSQKTARVSVSGTSPSAKIKSGTKTVTLPIPRGTQLKFVRTEGIISNDHIFVIDREGENETLKRLITRYYIDENLLYTTEIKVDIDDVYELI